LDPNVEQLLMSANSEKITNSTLKTKLKLGNLDTQWHLKESKTLRNSLVEGESEDSLNQLEENIEDEDGGS
jgi:hypothetical protein